jgi:hypothetical protein
MPIGSRLLAALIAAIAALALVPATGLAAAPVPPLPPIVCPAGICVPPLPVPMPSPPLPVPFRPPAPSPTPTASPTPAPSPVLPPGPPAPEAPLTPESNLQAIGKWVMGGANWSVCQIPSQLGLSVDLTRCLPDQAVKVKVPDPKDWFAPIYRRMVEIAGLLILPLLLLAFLQSLLRREPAMAVKAAFLYVPLAIIFSAIAVSVTQTLMAVTDSFSDFMLNGYQGQVAATIGSLAGVLAAGAAGSVFTVGTSAAAVIAAMVAIVAALAIVVELLARQALIYAAVLFLPLAFAAMVWPQLMRWTIRLVEVVVTAVLAKFVIVSVLVLGSAAFTSPGGGGPFDSQVPPSTTLLVGMLLVGLAAMSPIALLWALPTFESAVLAQFHGAARAPLSAVPHTVERSVYHLGLQRMGRDRSRQGAAGALGGQVMVFGPGTAVIVRPPRNPQSPGGGSPPPARGGGPAGPRPAGPGPVRPRGRGPYPSPPSTRRLSPEKEEVNARAV